MKNVLSIIFLFVFSAVILIGQEEKPTLAILDVVARGVEESRGKIVYEYIIDRINRAGNYAIVERAALDKALKELEISNSEIVDEKTAIEIGKISGATFILVSSLILDEKTYYLSMRVVSVKTGKIARTSIKKTEQFSNVEGLTAETVEYLLGKEASGEIAKKTTVDTTKKDTGKTDSDRTDNKDSLIKKDEVAAGKDKDSSGAQGGSYFSAGAGFGVSFTVGEVNKIWGMGYAPLLFFGYNLTLDWGIVGFGFLTGTTILGTQPAALYQFNLFSCPLAAIARYKTNLDVPFFGFIELGGGGSLLVVNFKQDYEIDKGPAIKPMFLCSLGAGYNFSKSLNVSIAGSASIVLMDNAMYIDIMPVISAEYNF